eukprot:g1826.t1
MPSKNEPAFQTRAMLALELDDETALAKALDECAGADTDMAVRRGALGSPGFVLLPTLYARDMDRLIHIAARNGGVRCSLLLLLRCASIEKNRDGKLPQQLAQRSNRPVFEALAEQNAERKRKFGEIMEGRSHDEVMVWIQLLAPLSARSGATLILTLHELDEPRREELRQLLSVPHINSDALVMALEGLRTDERQELIVRIQRFRSEGGKVDDDGRPASPTAASDHAHRCRDANNILIDTLAAFALADKRALLTLLARSVFDKSVAEAAALLLALPAADADKSAIMSAIASLTDDDDALALVHVAISTTDELKLSIVDALARLSGREQRKALVHFVSTLQPSALGAFSAALEPFLPDMILVTVLGDIADAQHQLDLMAAVRSLAFEQAQALVGGLKPFDSREKLALMRAIGSASQLELGQLLSVMGNAPRATQVRLVSAMGGMTPEIQRRFIGVCAGMVQEEQANVVRCMKDVARDVRGPFTTALAGLDDDTKLLAVDIMIELPEQDDGCIGGEHFDHGTGAGVGRCGDILAGMCAGQAAGENGNQPVGATGGRRRPRKLFATAAADLLTQERTALITAMTAVPIESRADCLASAAMLPVELRQTFVNVLSLLPTAQQQLLPRALDGARADDALDILRTANDIGSDDQRAVLLGCLATLPTPVSRRTLLRQRRRRLKRCSVVDDLAALSLARQRKHDRVAGRPLSARELKPKRYI